MMPSTIFDNSF